MSPARSAGPHRVAGAGRGWLSRLCVVLSVRLAVPILTAGFGGVQAVGQISKQDQLGERQALQRFLDRTEAEERRADVARRHFLAGQDLKFEEAESDASTTVLWRVEDGFPRFVGTLTNLDAARAVDADRLWRGGDGGFAVDGTGVIVGVWDAGAVRRTHREFGSQDAGTVSRVVQRDGSTSINNHSTAVAGGIAGLGVHPEAIGIAPGATVWSHNWYSDLSKMATAASQGLRASNHSYGEINGWGPSMTVDGVRLPSWYGDTRLNDREDERFGLYTNASRSWDELARLAPGLLIIKAAGNDRGSGQAPGSEHWVYDTKTFKWVRSTETRDLDGGEDGYGSIIGDAAVAKNVVSVAAVAVEPGFRTNPAAIQSQSSAAWGPTVDGRIKPDLVAPGVGGFSAAGWEDDAYMNYSGSSMAAAVTTGLAALLLERESAQGVGPWNAATRKALLIHTAREAGPGPGPDYQFGWGMLDGHAALRLLSEDALGGGSLHLREYALQAGQEITLPLDVEGDGPLKVTLAWADPESEAFERRPSNPSPALVNDLDLRVVGPTGTHFPWVLDPARPELPAARGDNALDNVEQVVVEVPGPGSYLVRVSHKRELHGGSQPVSIVLSGVFNPGLSIDHDGDGIQTRYEDVDGDGSVFNDDTDSDDVADYLDPDDDGDGIPTAVELAGALVAGRPVNPPDSNDSGIPDYLENLPVELVSFSAVVHDEAIHLTWITASESGNAGFEVQHALIEGGRTPSFRAVGWVDGAGSTLASRTYSFPVRNLGYGYHLFRLRQVDFDGSASFSSTIDVVWDWNPARPHLSVYPNPAQELVTVEIGVPNETPVRVAVFDLLGRERQVVFEGISGVDRIVRRPIFVQNLPAGVYYVRALVGSTVVAGRPLVVASGR